MDDRTQGWPWSLLHNSKFGTSVQRKHKTYINKLKQMMVFYSYENENEDEEMNMKKWWKYEYHWQGVGLI